ncbi:hypothetical protein [Rhodoferax sp.]|uniref:hypothetical protein n=1 Tax=Rhodoferax sp. TaxID=50421 RepID=UPI0008CB0D96|nr:hypothetical protein [Rhodoferax sp.]OGB40942.1 MAG: hypothetical protein A2461_09315 [Burkholderiales bacterium RIFOXYC2_FULL_59_8]OGB51647.1 MAG: hypothetical protein A2503_06230 [Burkholderiales bacterium RIFOXYD12_FULL_59_19]OGB81207.1 MAG: hypothetical protein A2496_06170 [Burkholderiales bacterium RIFOXYC12_FULL_60_6]MDO8319929.1 hypothetical protein [Rhodoferax sp.]MDP2680009.1 hypothetical protein [Rhodoferax sp.]
MKKLMKTLCAAAVLAVLSSVALAKLPPPTDEAKAKAAEAAPKAAWAGKVDAFKLCQAQDRAAAHYLKTAGKGAAPASSCVDPGPFVVSPAGAAAAASAAAPAKKS